MPDYYDISILQTPLWTDEVAVYFFLGGTSAGAYLLSRAAARLGVFPEIVRTGAVLSALTVLPAAPLLIADLGDPKRFHHMLRVWKPQSPMNLGSWILTGYSPLCVLAGLRQLLGPKNLLGRLIDQSDLAGAPLAVGMCGYTGVLLSTTSTPVWCKNPWIGPLFSTTALRCGASAIALALSLRGNSPALEAVDRFDEAAGVVEAVMIAGFLQRAGELAKPLLEGSESMPFWAGVVGGAVVAPPLLRRLPGPKPVRVAAASVSALLGGLALRWVFVRAGRSSAADPAAARAISSPRRA